MWIYSISLMGEEGDMWVRRRRRWCLLLTTARDEWVVLTRLDMI